MELREMGEVLNEYFLILFTMENIMTAKELYKENRGVLKHIGKGFWPKWWNTFDIS